MILAEDEGDFCGFAPVAELVPVESRLAADDESCGLAAEGGDFPLEGVGVAGVKIALQVFLPLGIGDTDAHRVGMQVDAAVELVWLLIKFHHAFPGLRVKRFQR
jgi:hypothetical protein